MATVYKQSIEFKVVTLGGNSFTAKDTADAKAGSLAFSLFKAHDTVEIQGESDTTYVPYHAIDHVVVTKTSSTEDVKDDNCVVDEETPETPDEP